MDDHSITIDHEENPVKSKRCISKVHVGLRNGKPEAYAPVLVSIGPYHKANPKLQAMQQNKESYYLKSLLKRRNGNLESRGIYLAELKKFDGKARKCYVDPVDSDDFAEMMLLDGCFIVEFLRKKDRDVKVKFDKDDPIKRVSGMQNQILSDMMLLENQLPYFVLSKVYNMTKSDGEKPLEEMVMSCFNFMLPRPRLNSKNAFGNIGEINHLLHLIHISCRPFPEKTIKNKEDSNSGSAENRGFEESSDDQTRCPLLPQNNDSGSAKNRGSEESSDDQTCCILLPQNNESGSDKSNEMKNQMGTVVELQEAGVKFKKVGKIYNGALMKEEDDYVSLFDIDFTYEQWKVPCFKCGVPCFKCGVMKVPRFKVDKVTETLLRNLIAYEQHFRNVHTKYFTDFAGLMNQLINSKEDAKALRFEGIIMNFLGGDDELSKLFNTLIDGVCESSQPYYDLKVRQKVEKHCKTRCNTWMANLNRKYFNNPWAGISTFAAVFLLLLTVVQTVVALITWLA